MTRSLRHKLSHLNKIAADPIETDTLQRVEAVAELIEKTEAEIERLEALCG